MSTAEPVLRVLVVDDHPVYRDGLAALLGTVADVEVVGTAADGAAAVEQARDLAPDVVVMDVQMPVLDGVEATRRITGDSPSVAVVVLTMSEDDDTVFAALRAGARGYLLKGADADEVVQALRTVAAGGAVFGASLAVRIAQYFAGRAPLPAGDAPADADPFPQLTAREREVLDLVAAGRSNPQIAELLFLSPKTVRNCVSNVFAKLHVADRAEAIVRARDAGLGR
ncbi:response regulator transcription factor [Aquipuribacter sp. SD81]|uniref:response regulator transcription factor n=1 Tax=Aquipuribacter sp. SD81 TaxID=3127703 RepID=UPI003016BCF2